MADLKFLESAIAGALWSRKCLAITDLPPSGNPREG
jgi:hypothetical protein